MERDGQQISEEAALREGVTHQRAGRLREAGEVYARILAVNPNHAQALNYMGTLSFQLGQEPQALGFILKAINLEPGRAAFHCNLGEVLRGMGKTREAVRCFQKAVEIDPNMVMAHRNLGIALAGLGEKEAAKASFERVLALDPANAEARHMVDALAGEKRKTADADYVSQVFDAYAEDFDRHLTEKLGYRTPELLCGALVKAAGGIEGWKILDIGCGTGLCGPHLKPAAGWLGGVDLSAKMVAKTEATGLYDKAWKADLTAALAEFTGELDAIVSADVFVYIGELAETFAAAVAALKPGGFFAFSTESSDGGETYILQSSGRFAHNPAYIEQLAAAHGFAVEAAEKSVIRREGGKDVWGMLFILKHL